MGLLGKARYESDWPAMAEGPRCERCGQVHLSLPQTGRFGCGRCGWPLVPREVQRAQQRRSRRIATALIAVAVVIAGLLVARSISGPQARFRNVPPSEQHNHAGETTVSGIPSAVTMPPAAPARPDAGEAPPALAEPSSLARSFPTQTPGEPPVLAQQPALQNPVLAELQGSILELESAPVSERDTYRWNVAAGDCYWLYARELALSSPSAPPASTRESAPCAGCARTASQPAFRPRKSTCGARSSLIGAPWNWPRHRNTAPACTSVWVTSSARGASMHRHGNTRRERRA